MNYYKRSKMLLTRRLWVPVVIVAALDSFSYAADPQQSLTDLIEIALQNESCLQDEIQISGKAELAVWDDKANNWDVAPVPVEFSAKCDSLIVGKFYIELKPMLIPWKDGPSKFFASDRIVAYNGKFISELTNREGHPDKMIKRPAGLIRDFNVESDIEVFRITGIEFLSFNLRLFDGVSLADTARIGTLGFRAVLPSDLAERPTDGSRLLTYKRESRGFEEQIWFDTDHGNSLTKYEYSIVDNEGHTVGTTTTYSVKNFKQASNGMFYPTEMEYLRVSSGVPQRRWRISITCFTFISHQKPSTKYVADFPVGTWVKDSRLGVSFSVGPTRENLIQTLQLDSQ